MVARRPGLSAGTKAGLTVRDRALVVRKSKGRLTLADLLAGCRARNRHKIIAWGPPVGRERL